MKLVRRFVYWAAGRALQWVARKYPSTAELLLENERERAQRYYEAATKERKHWWTYFEPTDSPSGEKLVRHESPICLCCGHIQTPQNKDSPCNSTTTQTQPPL